MDTDEVERWYCKVGGIEVGRWWAVSREEGVCRHDLSGEGEGVEHLVMRCTSVAGEREKLMRLIRKMVAE